MSNKPKLVLEEDVSHLRIVRTTYSNRVGLLIERFLNFIGRHLFSSFIALIILSIAFIFTLLKLEDFQGFINLLDIVYNKGLTVRISMLLIPVFFLKGYYYFYKMSNLENESSFISFGESVLIFWKGLINYIIAYFIYMFILIDYA